MKPILLDILVDVRKCLIKRIKNAQKYVEQTSKVYCMYVRCNREILGRAFFKVTLNICETRKLLISHITIQTFFNNVQ